MWRHRYKWTGKIRRIDIYDVVEIKSASYVDMMDGLSAGFCPGFYKTSDYRLWKLNFLILTLLVKIQLKMVNMTRNKTNWLPHFNSSMFIFSVQPLNFGMDKTEI